ncbi:restriction endonuclease subunit S [Nostoc sp.]
MKIERYQAYKDSGVEWLGEVPEHWEVKHFKNLAEIKGGKDSKAVELEEGCYPIYGSGGIFGRASQYLHKKPSVLLGRKGTVDKPLFVTEPFWSVDTMFYTDIKNSVYPKFFYYQCLTIQFGLYQYGSAVPSMAQNVLRQILFATPNYIEQKTIADYLDTKTAQCDRKIYLLTQKATLYGKLKQSLINETVTRGLDKSVPMKDSGVEWLGDVPEHWEVKHFKNLAEIKGGKDSKAVELEEGCYPIYGSGGIFGRASQYLHKKPSVLLGRKGTVDKPLFVTEPFWSVDTMFYTDIKNSVYPKFFYYQCLTIQFGLYQYGSAVPSMAQNVLRQILFATPNYIEQKTIADYLDTKTAQIDQIIQTINTQIEKLKELRKTLINDVVTGKIRVTDHQ